MATVKTIESNFESMSEDDKRANIATLGYIKNLASTTNTDIQRWDILKIFGSGTGANLLTDKKQINKIFFEKLSTLTEKTEMSFPDVENIPQLGQALERSFMATIDSRKQHLQYEIDECNRQLERKNRDILTLIAQASEHRKQLLSIQVNPEPLLEVKKEIQEVLKSGIWINPVVKDNYLYFNTASNIHLTHKNRAAGIDCELDLGQFAVKIDLNTFHMWVIPYKNNIVYDDRYSKFFHPHVSQEGNICWGNALGTMQGHMKTFSIGKVIQLLYSLLTSYSDASPYIHLVSLRDRHKKYARIPLALKHPDKVKSRADAAEETEPDELGEDPMLSLILAPEDIRAGLRVQCEMYDSEPRWDYRTDRALDYVGALMSEEGEVTFIDDESFTVRLANGLDWNWPMPGHRDYTPTQWHRPGYLRRRP